MIRFDICPNIWKNTVSRIIRAPQVIGYDEGGLLTDAVRRKPYAVILLDEIEKAPQIFSIFFCKS